MDVFFRTPNDEQGPKRGNSDDLEEIARFITVEVYGDPLGMLQDSMEVVDPKQRTLESFAVVSPEIMCSKDIMCQE
jgi:hypothetical protein